MEFLTIRKAAATGVAPENVIRNLVSQGKCPGFYSGNRFLVNVTALAEQLDAESRNAVGVGSNTPFQTIEQAARTTGLSKYYLRKGCKDGTVPHVKTGTKYLVNVPKLLRQLDAEP